MDIWCDILRQVAGDLENGLVPEHHPDRLQGRLLDVLSAMRARAMLHCTGMKLLIEALTTRVHQRIKIGDRFPEARHYQAKLRALADQLEDCLPQRVTTSEVSNPDDSKDKR